MTPHTVSAALDCCGGTVRYLTFFPCSGIQRSPHGGINVRRFETGSISKSGYAHDSDRKSTPAAEEEAAAEEENVLLATSQGAMTWQPS